VSKQFLQLEQKADRGYPILFDLLEQPKLICLTKNASPANLHQRENEDQRKK